MEEAPVSTADPPAGSPEATCSSHHRSRTRSRTRSRSFSGSSSPSPRPSAVPFSWEQSPGIPKPLLPGPPASATAEEFVAQPLLPLPPPVRSHSDLATPRKKRSAGAPPADPFAAALALCAKDRPDAGDEIEELGDVPDPAAPRRSSATIAHRLGLFDLYGSCKAACAVVDATIRLPRPGSTGLLGRRAGSDST